MTSLNKESDKRTKKKKNKSVIDKIHEPMKKRQQTMLRNGTEYRKLSKNVRRTEKYEI